MKAAIEDTNDKDIFKIVPELADLWFPMASLYNAVSEYDFNRIPEESYRTETKEHTETMMYGMIVIYQFALFESYINKSLWELCKNEPLVKRLSAYWHIRNAFAHSVKGKRVYENKKAAQHFREIFSSCEPLAGVTVDKNDCVKLTLKSIEELNSLLRRVASIYIRKTKMPQPRGVSKNI